MGSDIRNQWHIIVILIITGVFFTGTGYFLLFAGNSFSTLHVYELNGTFIPQGTRFSLTDENFKEFPQLTPIIRDKTQNPQNIFPDGTRSYSVPLTESDMNRFIERYWTNSTGEDRRFFEYNGQFYEFTFPEMH